MRLGLLALVSTVGLAACGGGGGDLSPMAAEGATIAQSAGCVSCHGSEGQGGVGPAWVGLHGSSVDLADGSTVVADDAYLRSSIVEPDAQLVAGYEIRMPENGLDDAEVEAVIAYIRELG